MLPTLLKQQFLYFKVVALSKKYIALHEEYAPKIIELAKNAVTTGAPINRPIWWIDPTDQVALGIDSGKLSFYSTLF